MGWAGYIKVDGTAYTFLGAPSVPNTSPALAVQKSMTVSSYYYLMMSQSLNIKQFTATQSTFVMTAGPVDLTVNFLSPVEVNRTHRVNVVWPLTHHIP